jgi:hypothetical protein
MMSCVKRKRRNRREVRYREGLDQEPRQEPRGERKWWGMKGREVVCDAPMAPVGVGAARAGVDEEALWMRGPQGPMAYVLWRPRVG